MGKFDEILELVYSKSSFQKKKIAKHLAGQNSDYFVSAEKFACDYLSFLDSENISIEAAVDAYIKMCNDMFLSQLYFAKTGKYPTEKAENAFKNVYDNEMEMTSYMVGLAISQYLWPTHYRMYQFFVNYIRDNASSIFSYMEIGPGHGLFLKDAYQIIAEHHKNVPFTAIDISQTSLSLSKSVVKLLVGNNNIKFSVLDALKYNEKESFDFIAMGEVLEHVDFPEKLLSKISRLLSAEGSAFISTCINCPSIDHVYHFKCAREIGEMLSENNLVVKSELFLPVEDLPMETIIQKKITINYCAIVQRMS